MVTEPRRYEARQATIWSTARWGGPWREEPRVYLDWLAMRCGPAISAAQLAREYGQLMLPGTNKFGGYPPLDLAGRFVKIEIPQTDPQTGDEQDPIRWYGRIWDDHRDRLGMVKGLVWDGDNPLSRDDQTGRQSFYALGLEYELAKANVTSSVVLADGRATRIGRGVAFNRGGGQAGAGDNEVRPNASPPRGRILATARKLFADDLTSDECTYWSAGEIVAYLLEHQTLRGQSAFGVAEIPWVLDVAVENLVLEWQAPPLEAHGRSVKDIIDGLVDRRRLAGYYVYVRELTLGKPLAYVRVFSFSTERLRTPDGKFLPKNYLQAEWDFESDVTVETAKTTRSVESSYEIVRVVGARCTSTFSISPQDATLEADWTAAEETAYEAGASGEAGYAGADRAEKERRNARARAEPRLGRVYAHFRLPLDWDGRAADGEGGEKSVVAPHRAQWAIFWNWDLNNLLDFDARPKTHWRPGIRFESWLPLLVGCDYSGDKIKKRTVVNNNPPGSPPEYLRPIVLLKTHDGGTTEYQHVELLCAEAELELVAGGGRDWACDTRMQAHGAGIIVRVTKPGAQHLIAYSDFTPLAGVRETPADLDWTDNLIATVCWQQDHYHEVFFPPLDEEVTAHWRELRIDLGDDYRLDYVARDTVLGVANGQLVRTTGGYVRQDTRRMNQLAQLAWNWYRRPRQAFAITRKQIWRPFELGTLITKIGPAAAQEEVNCCVTGLVYDLVRQTTTVETDFAHFAAEAFAPPPSSGAS